MNSNILIQGTGSSFPKIAWKTKYFHSVSKRWQKKTPTPVYLLLCVLRHQFSSVILNRILRAGFPVENRLIIYILKDMGDDKTKFVCPFLFCNYLKFVLRWRKMELWEKDVFPTEIIDIVVLINIDDSLSSDFTFYVISASE
jgi:hypothetical protein